jgi:hypothetical protein
MKLPLSIHCWGGYGSQLNALAVAHYISRKYSRKIRLIFHSGGVTRRPVEIIPLLPNDFSFTTVDDYNPIRKTSNSQRKKLWKSLLAKVIQATMIVQKPETLEELHGLKPWTISFRGSYSHCAFGHDDLLDLFAYISDGERNEKTDLSILHYRLGDLLDIDKSYVAASDVAKVLKLLPTSEWQVFSDSPFIAVSKLEKELSEIKLIATNSSSSNDILLDCVASKFFVGTNSKISIWAAVFRTVLFNRISFLPIGLQSLMKALVPTTMSNNITYY